MTQEEKHLLLVDLYARLPYGVKILHEGWDYEWDDEMSTRERVVSIDEHFIYTKVIDTHSGEEYRDDKHSIDTFDDKLFLRPMSSMTEEEQFQLGRLLGATSYNLLKGEYSSLKELLEYVYKNHIDLFGLIPKGLALEAPEDMYK